MGVHKGKGTYMEDFNSTLSTLFFRAMPNKKAKPKKIGGKPLKPEVE